MSITTTAPVTTITTAPAKPLVISGLTATAVAAVATTALAAAGEGAGISLSVGGAPIPVTGFGVLTAIFSAMGVVLALVLARKAHRPRTAFVRTTIALTALSLVPDVLADAATDTTLLMMSTHLVAAAIVIPAIARRLR
ncbi:hypothetical protein SAMN05192558_108370 [Actinokineospora alba]|uniref:Cell envelope biogenesis protein OmpA n=1 Tax=Actinokineospora alba TaxID=504798 RepID=A0A1H0SAZ8_9PSEU|nr:DUF6069 family protein [Actinokineospora alba]TDP66679.1 hypothetical protein C8E96_2191 [Actinokineospora alba]SDI52193.1 hypothetical protein SAMN05421871_105381 [Actinokineospora alba]SDP38825.1 hypothetical protein SAMN05192558_108370 [Actinokineospora alba]